MTRRRFKIFIAIAAIALLALSLADHAGAFAFSGNDWRRFNGQSVHALRIIDGDTVDIALDTDRSTPPATCRARLLGVDAPDLPSSHGARASLDYLTHRLANRSVIVKLDGTQTRDADGALRAYFYVTPNDLLNADLVRDGAAYADRREHHTYASAFEQNERDARSHHRGLWNGLRDADQPVWRQAWLKEWLSHHR